MVQLEHILKMDSFLQKGIIKIIYREGKYKEYYENGNIRLTGQYKNGERVGKWIEYHQNGKVSREKIYDENTDEEKKTERKKADSSNCGTRV